MTACAITGCATKEGAAREAFAPWAVCRFHGVRFGDVVDELPRFLVHLREIGKPYAQASPLGAEAHATPDGFANIPEAIIAADEIESEALWIARAMIDDASGVLGRRLSFPERRPWRGDVLAWLADHGDDALRFAGLADFIAALLSEVETAHHRWPTADDTRPAVPLAMPCPRCGLRSLVKRPVVWPGQAERIDCTDADCARIYTTEEIEKFERIAAREGKMGKWRTEGGA